MIIIDSNIWAYYFDKERPEHQYVVKSIEGAFKKGAIAINTVIIMEVAHFLLKSLGPLTGMEKMRKFLSYPFTIGVLDYDITVKAVELLARYSHLGVGGRDATILATAESLKIKAIMTHDRAFQRIHGFQVIDPIPS